MVTKLHKSGKSSGPAGNAKPDREALASSVKDSAQQIWQAGLGAFAKAQAEGGRAFEALVKEGTTLQRKTQAAAEERITEATNRMTNMATDISSKASGHWDKLENIFEERVAKALNKLGVPSAKDVSALIARIDALNLSVQELSAGKVPAAKGVAAKTKTKAKTRPVAKVTVAPSPVKKASSRKPAVKAAAKTTRRATAKRSAAGKPAAA
ncbi:MAG TPA: phasin family protein [Burkholderiaceae bacterium]|nr:phasin family protein [Burkholderiaceae bacterium]